MRPQKVEDIELINRLMAVLRSKGYDGASLNELASASGLQKASLYHRFPGGKKDIVMSVLNHINKWSEQHIEKVIKDSNLSTQQKLSTVIQHLNEFYDGGKNACVMKTLSMENSFELFGEYLKQGIQNWLSNFSDLALQFGHNKNKANSIANQTLIQIQGSLVLSKTIGNTTPFETALISIQKLYN